MRIIRIVAAVSLIAATTKEMKTDLLTRMPNDLPRIVARRDRGAVSVELWPG